nr:helix-turn-helix transcriptional regulator [uncultured Moellerella sp.]
MPGMKKRSPSRINENAGEVLRLLRKRKQLSGEDLGKLTGLSQQQISRYERGVNHLTLSLLVQFLVALDTTLDEFFYQLNIYCGFADNKDMLSTYYHQYGKKVPVEYMW